MHVVDAQVHIWGANTPERPWREGEEKNVHLPEPLDKEKLLAQMDRVGVHRAFLVSPVWEYEHNDVVLEAAESYPDQFGAILRFTWNKPVSLEYLKEWFEKPNVFGARTTFARPWSKDWPREGKVDWFWPLAEELGVPLMIYIPGQYDVVASIAQRHPDLRLAVCHFGMAVAVRDHEIERHVEGLLDLARFPNVAVKASCLPSYVTEPYPFPSLHGHIRRVVEAFGSQRVFWGSDLSRLSCDYAEVYRLFTEELHFLSEDDREWIMGRGICEWFGWDLP